MAKTNRTDGTKLHGWQKYSQIVFILPWEWNRLLWTDRVWVFAGFAEVFPGERVAKYCKWASDFQSSGGACLGVSPASSCVDVPWLSLSERCYRRNFARRQIRETRGANKRARGQINKRETLFCLGTRLRAKPGIGKQPQGGKKVCQLVCVWIAECLKILCALRHNRTFRFFHVQK